MIDKRSKMQATDNKNITHIHVTCDICNKLYNQLITDNVH